MDSEDEGCWFVSLVLVGSLAVPRGFSIFYYFAIFLLVAPLHRLVFIILTRLQTHYSSFFAGLPACVSCLMSHCVCAARAVRVLSVYLRRIFVLFSLTNIRI